MNGNERSLTRLSSLYPNQFIHDYNQIKSYQRYYRMVSPCGTDSVKIRERRTSHQRPYCTDEVYYPRLWANILLPSIPCLIVAMPIRLGSSGGLRLHRTPTDCKNSQAMCQTNNRLREMQQYELLARNLSSFRTARALTSRVPT